MIRQKSFENEKPTLYLVATPIGNLSEMSPRAIEILKSVNVIACEDTRTSGQMLKHFDIHNRLIAYQNFNEDPSAKGILNLLSQGQNVALISDAGYPLINDPGCTEIAARAADKLFGEESRAHLEKVSPGEDFSHYMKYAPGCFVFVGTYDEEKGLVYDNHSSCFDIDESILIRGAMLAAQYVFEFSD